MIAFYFGYPPEREDDLAKLARVIDRQSSTIPFLAYLRDKAILRSEAGDAFLMYAVQETGGDTVLSGLRRRLSRL